MSAPATGAVRTIPQEARPFQGNRAGIVSRGVAGGVDLAAVFLSLIVVYFTISVSWFVIRPTKFHFPAVSLTEVLAGVAVVGWTYLTVSWASTGRTYGDHLLGLRVVGREGDRMRAAGAGLRAIFCLLVPVGLLWCAVDRSNRSVQDLVLRTSVVYDWENRPANGVGA
jgi:uncharacterized RDD family membrane protein YckC